MLTINSDSFTNDGILSLYLGTLSTTGVLDVGNGTLSGSGLIIASTLQLDSDPSTLLLNIDSAAQFDAIDVTGNVALGGYLELSLPVGIDPSLTADETFAIMTVESGYDISGSFLNVPTGGRLETIDGLGSFEVDYGGNGSYANQVVLSNFEPRAVPEPGSLSLLAIGSLATVLGRRRSNNRSLKV